jgi:hypothetical protein
MLIPEGDTGEGAPKAGSACGWMRATRLGSGAAGCVAGRRGATAPQPLLPHVSFHSMRASGRGRGTPIVV